MATEREALVAAMVMRRTPCTGRDGARNASDETAKQHTDARYGMKDRILPSAARSGSRADRALSTVALRDRGFGGLLSVVGVLCPLN